MPPILHTLPPGQALAAVLMLYVLGPFVAVWTTVELARIVRLAVRGR